MRFLAPITLLLALSWSCSAPFSQAEKGARPPLSSEEPAAETGSEVEVPSVQGAAGGSGEESSSGNKLTGVPGIDRGQEVEMRILDARGTGRIGGVPIAQGKTGEVPTGSWMLTDPGSEYEITVNSSLVGEGIVRLAGASAFLVEPTVPGAPPRFRLFGGTGSFYFAHIPLGRTTILTPAGPLVTRGAVFTVAVSPDLQVLVTCREGAVFLTGTQNAEAMPGQVLVADRIGRNRVYAMTPSESQVFTDRWLQVMTEEASPVVAAALPRKLSEWKAVNPRIDPEQTRSLALWFRQAKMVLPTVPGPEVWSGALNGTVVTSPWRLPLETPGLLGEDL